MNYLENRWNKSIYTLWPRPKSSLSGKHKKQKCRKRNIITEIKNLFSNDTEKEIKTNTINDTSLNDISLNTISSSNNSETNKETYHIPGNNFTYNDAKAVCKAFNSELATFKHLKEAQKKGASWCSYGWTKDQLGLYPTSLAVWKKLQEKEKD